MKPALCLPREGGAGGWVAWEERQGKVWRGYTHKPGGQQKGWLHAVLSLQLPRSRLARCSVWLL